MSEPDNLVLVHLREMRAAIESMRSDMHERFGAVDERLTRVEDRLDMMHLNGMKALKQFVGHRAMVERGIGSMVEDFTAAQRDIETLKSRVAELEGARA